MTAEARVAVMRDRHVSGTATGGVRVMPLRAALATRWSSDAHVQAAVADDALPTRITKATLDRCPVRIVAFVVDLDAPGHVASSEWRDETHHKIEAALDALSEGVAYDTRGGARIVWRLEPEVVIADGEDAREWSRRYVAACAWLEAHHGLKCDRSCSDFQRLFRLPFVTRDGRPPEDVWTFGDLAKIGAFPLDEIAPATMIERRSTQRRGCVLTPAASERSERRPLEPSDTEPPKGALFAALDAAGLIRGVGPLPRTYLIACPREAHHSCGYAGDRSTLLYLPNWFGDPGVIRCLHASCATMRTAKQWRRAIAQLCAADAARSEEKPSPRSVE